MDYGTETFCGDSTKFQELLSFMNFVGTSSCLPEARGLKRKRIDEADKKMEATLTALTTAITTDDVTSVSLLLEQCGGVPLEDVHVGPFDYRTNKPRFPLLHFAAREGSIKVLRFLMEEKALNKDKFTKAAGTPLSRAVHSSRLDCAEYLIDAGCDVNRKVPVCQIRECRINLVTPLMIAVSREEPEIVKKILESGRCHVNATAGLRETALYFAIKHATHSLQYVEMLLDAGVRPNIQSTTDEPPLLLALKLKQCDVAKKLIAHGCDVNAKMESPASFGISALHVAVEMDDLDLVRRLVQAGADLEERMNPDATLGATPLLHCVAGNRAYNAMSVLLEAGSDVTAVDKFGRNICHWLVLNGDDHPLSFLLARCGQTVEMERSACDGNDTTPLDYAIVTNNVRAAKILLSYNCKVRKIYKNQSESPLEFAVKRGFNELLPCLHQAGCDVTARTANGLQEDTGRKVGVHPALRHNRPMVDWLKNVSSKPRSLLDMARLSIRENMPTDIVKDVKELEIPRLLQQYVLNIDSGIN